MTISDLYHESRRRLLEKEDPQMASLLARNLMCFVTGKSHTQILSEQSMYVGDETCDKMQSLVSRVLADEPLAYVLGEWDFYGMTLHVDNRVLIPRDDTCAVTELAIKQAVSLGTSPRILDLCTGSGCIGLAVATRVKDAKVTLADISRDALVVAKKNIVTQKLTGRVACVQVDALDIPPAFLGQFDMIVSNPPYITSQEMLELPVSVKAFEPHLALHGGEDGLIFYRTIAGKYKSALKIGGFLCFEFGMGQGDAVCEILEKNGYTILERSKDFNNRERAVIARNDRKDD